MPVKPDAQTEFVRPRWSAYVRDLVDSGEITRTRLATLAEAPTSRVKEWIEAERAVEPETAFQIGETLRDASRPTERASSSREGVDAYEFARLRLAAAAEERRRPFTAHLMAEIEAERRLEDPGIQRILQSNEAGSASDLRIDKIPAFEAPAGVFASAC